MKKINFPLAAFDKKNDYKFGVEANTYLINKNHLTITYSIIGDMSGVIIPELEEEKRKVIGLWESTCFELFIKAPNSKNYFELNFSPEGHWNCFYFDKPGDYIKPFPIMTAPTTKVLADQKKDGFYKIEIKFNIDQLISTFRDKDLDQVDIGISAIVVKDHSTTFWALNHFGTCPNFHDFRAFTPWRIKSINYKQ